MSQLKGHPATIPDLLRHVASVLEAPSEDLLNELQAGLPDLTPGDLSERLSEHPWWLDECNIKYFPRTVSWAPCSECLTDLHFLVCGE